jgi:predicted amidohydrolase
MKISLAQTRPHKGDVEKNIVAHMEFVRLAVSHNSDLIVFPELSLTGYEPTLAKELATTENDPRLDDLQKISNEKNITICAGMPTRKGESIRISMLIFSPHQPRRVYSKQFLHEDEFPFFENGCDGVFLSHANHVIAPAICYESLLPGHAETAFKNGATVYLASVAKSARGVEKAFRHYPAIAKQYSMFVCMANCVGASDNFLSVGKSAVWNSDGVLMGELDETNEGILVFDMENGTIIHASNYSFKPAIP